MSDNPRRRQAAGASQPGGVGRQPRRPTGQGGAAQGRNCGHPQHPNRRKEMEGHGAEGSPGATGPRLGAPIGEFPGWGLRGGAGAPKKMGGAAGAGCGSQLPGAGRPRCGGRKSVRGLHTHQGMGKGSGPRLQRRRHGAEEPAEQMGHSQGAAARGQRGAEKWSERQAEGGSRRTKGVQGECGWCGWRLDGWILMGACLRWPNGAKTPDLGRRRGGLN